MKVRPNTTFIALLRGAPAGLVGTITAGLKDLSDDSIKIAHTTAGIDEISAPSGNYRKEFTLPADEGDYIVEWINDDVESIDDVVLEVRVNAPVTELELPGSYASRSDLETYLEDGLPAGYDDDYLDKVLVKASQDVDLYANAVTYRVGSDLKFATTTDPFEWEPIYTAARGYIVEATCAQAEYRLAKGDQFFVEVQRAEGEFANTQVVQPRFGPKAAEALRRTGIKIRYVGARLI